MSNSLNGATPRMVRQGTMAEQVVVVDGLPGCGKTMLSPIIGALPRVQLIQYSYELEYICALQALGKITPDAAAVFVQLMTDLRLYNVMMARETNFRLGDISSALRSARPWTYLRRLLQPGDEAVMDRMAKERPILHLTTHHVLPFGAPFANGLGAHVVIIELVRHPLYMVRQQAANQDRYGKDVRSFTICFDHHGTPLPYFAKGWEERFLASNAMERSIYMIQHLTERSRHVVASLPAGARVIQVPFECYVLHPWPYMETIEQALGVQMDGRTRRMMRRQRVPREKIAAGRPLKIYKKYGWRPPIAGADERHELAQRRAYAAANASAEAMQVLDTLCAEYEQTYLTGKELM